MKCGKEFKELEKESPQQYEKMNQSQGTSSCSTCLKVESECHELLCSKHSKNHFPLLSAPPIRLCFERFDDWQGPAQDDTVTETRSAASLTTEEQEILTVNEVCDCFAV